MGYIEKVFGPPGTGKTTYIVKRIKDLIQEGVINKDKIQATSLTHATKYALYEKLDKEGVKLERDKKQISTIHSKCYRAIRDKKGVKKLHIITEGEKKEFFSKKGFKYNQTDKEISEEEEFTIAEYSDTDGNKLYQAFQKLRLSIDFSLSPLENVKRLYQVDGDQLPVGINTFIKLYNDYIKFLTENDIYDFSRLLTDAYMQNLIVSGDILVLDEFQDKGSLHVELIKRWIPYFKYTVICGDDDQAIFTFSGADPKFLIEIEADKKTILPKSYRLPSNIHQFSQRIINKNRKRVKKEFVPAKEGGVIKDLFSFEDVLEKITKDKDRTFILCRNKYLISTWKNLLDKYDIPYRTGNGKLPAVVSRLQTLNKIRNKQQITDDEREKLFNDLKPLIREILGKKRVNKKDIFTITHKIAKRDYSGKEGKVAYLILNSSYENLFISYDKEEIKKWERRLNNIKDWEDPKVEITTMHKSKGLEADRVILDMAISKRTYITALKDIEAERRVFYVAATRAKKELYLYHPRNSYTFNNLDIL